MITKSKTLKSYFVRIFLLSSFIPFLVSIILLWSYISNSNEKITLANIQLKRSYDLEIIDSFHKVQSALTIIAQSDELKTYFNSTIDTEKKNLIRLQHAINLIHQSLIYKNAKWYIVNSRGKEILSINNKNSEKYNLKNDNHEIGVSLNLLKNEINFTIPISYKLSEDNKYFKKNLGYIILLLPISDVKNVFKNLSSIEKIPKNLNLNEFKTHVNIIFQKENNLIYLYLYILVSFICICIATFLGVLIFQKNIIDKILFLKSRVRNEMEYIEKFEIKNELESLSQTFDLYLRYTKFLQKEILKSSQLVAVGNIAHMIAHDVRKPFSKLIFFINEIKKIKYIEEAHKYINEFEQSFTSSIEYVEHILQEVMDAGITQLRILKDISLEEIIVKSFQNIPIIPDNCEINIEYNLSENIVLFVDELRITRVVVNIISNAIEAMNFNGKIWIESKEILIQNNLFMEICIGNSNSYIPTEIIDHIFEPFFTLKKEQGTGLGLSISQKIINLHGGKIECRSNKKIGVEFIITLPAKIEKNKSNLIVLPRFIRGNQTTSKQFIHNEANYIDNNDKEFIIVIDDDPLVCKSWQRILFDKKLITFSYPEEFYLFLETNKNFINKINIIISDYFFGKKSKLTFKDFVISLRKIFHGKLFLSSDYTLENTDIITEFKITILQKRPYTYQELLEK